MEYDDMVYYFYYLYARYVVLFLLFAILVSLIVGLIMLTIIHARTRAHYAPLSLSPLSHSLYSLTPLRVPAAPAPTTPLVLTMESGQFLSHLKKGG